MPACAPLLRLAPPGAQRRAPSLGVRGFATTTASVGIVTMGSSVTKMLAPAVAGQDRPSSSSGSLPMMSPLTDGAMKWCAATASAEAARPTCASRSCGAQSHS